MFSLQSSAVHNASAKQMFFLHAIATRGSACPTELLFLTPLPCLLLARRESSARAVAAVWLAHTGCLVILTSLHYCWWADCCVVATARCMLQFTTSPQRYQRHYHSQITAIAAAEPTSRLVYVGTVYLQQTAQAETSERNNMFTVVRQCVRWYYTGSHTRRQARTETPHCRRRHLRWCYRNNWLTQLAHWFCLQFGLLVPFSPSVARW